MTEAAAGNVCRPFAASGGTVLFFRAAISRRLCKENV